MIFLLGCAFLAILMALWNAANHSAPTTARLRRRQASFRRALALLAAEKAALRAYDAAMARTAEPNPENWRNATPRWLRSKLVRTEEAPDV